MKTSIIFLIFLFVLVVAKSQTLTSEQKNTISELSKKTSNVLSDLILVEFVASKKITDTIKINLQPATNINNKVTDFGNSFCIFLESELQSKLNSAIIKKYNYRVSYNSSSNSQDNDCDLKISYFMKDNALAISRIDLVKDNGNKVSLKPFEISQNMSNVKNLNSVSDNMYFDKIVSLKTDNQLFNSFLIYNSKKQEVKMSSSVYHLKNNENYKFRVSLIPKTYLYVFYYEQDKSSFYVIYPNTKQNNKQVTYKTKDIKNISFNNSNSGVIKVIVSNKILNLNDVITKTNNSVSPEQAEDIYKELLKKKSEFSTRNYNLHFD